MGSRACAACTEKPVMTCGRCTTTQCARHALKPGQRCKACERDYADEAKTRRAVKLIFAPPLGLFCGGAFFALVTLGGAIGTAVMCAVACALAVGSSTALCVFVDRSARAMFMRQRALGVPEARMLPPGRSHSPSSSRT
jgi:hypothetical protein